jgi:cell division protein FtsW (lipid II flippase)
MPNADVWISIGGLFSFQPGELAKICLAIFFAGYLVRTREALTSVGTRFLGMTWPRPRELGPLLLWAGAMAIIVLQRDLGTGCSSSACSSRCSTSRRARRAGSCSA